MRYESLKKSRRMQLEVFLNSRDDLLFACRIQEVALFWSSSFCVCLISYCNVEAGSLSSDKDLVSPSTETAS